MPSFAEQVKAFMSPTGWWTGLVPPRFYSYHPETFEFLGAGECDPSPLEEGVWLDPAHSTREPIPDRCPVGYSLVHEVDGKWRPWRDRRGEIVYVDGEFRSISTLGEHPELTLKVHDAQYLLDEGKSDDALGRIRMWVNDDVIDFVDQPSIQRRVLAGWEALGETIRPVDFDESDLETEAEMLARLDAEAAAAVEGKNKTEETDHV